MSRWKAKINSYAHIFFSLQPILESPDFPIRLENAIVASPFSPSPVWVQNPTDLYFCESVSKGSPALSLGPPVLPTLLRETDKGVSGRRKDQTESRSALKEYLCPQLTGCHLLAELFKSGWRFWGCST